jgi:hypothetical protein
VRCAATRLRTVIAALHYMLHTLILAHCQQRMSHDGIDVMMLQRATVLATGDDSSLRGEDLHDAKDYYKPRQIAGLNGVHIVKTVCGSNFTLVRTISSTDSTKHML